MSIRTALIVIGVIEVMILAAFLLKKFL